MRAVIVDTDPRLDAFLAERARLGLDHFDEMWEGELHMVPPPSLGHQLFGSRLLVALASHVEDRGLIMTYETGFFRDADDYRRPDLAVFRPEQASRRGLETADLVVEIRSPGDESYLKLPWYLANGCREVLIIDRDALTVELHTTAGIVAPAVSDVLGCTFETVDGPALRVTWDGGEATVRAR